MSDLNRGIMKFKNADKPVVVVASAILVLGSIVGLIGWALQTAYILNWWQLYNFHPRRSRFLPILTRLRRDRDWTNP